LQHLKGLLAVAEDLVDTNVLGVIVLSRFLVSIHHVMHELHKIMRLEISRFFVNQILP